MAAKKKSDGDRGMDNKGKIVGFKSVNVKPTEAFTAPGQRATGLGKSVDKDRFKIDAKTPVRNAGSGFAGSGAPFAAMPQKVSKGAVVDAALIIASTPGSGQVSKAIGKKVGQFVSGHTFDAAARGLETATGAGGRIKDVMTPFGKTIAGTKIGSAAEQSARIENLISGAAKTAKIAGGGAAKSVERAAKLASNAKPAAISGVIKAKGFGKEKNPTKKK